MPVIHHSQSSVALSCRGLVKRFGDVRAVDGLDLTIYRGECFGLLGPNGAGKTTTIEILEGLIKPDAGDVEVLESRWNSNRQNLHQRLGISLQETKFSERLTVEETLRLFRSFYRAGNDPDNILRQFSLEEKRHARVGKLSGGQKQRLAVACALIGSPDLLFLDEPTTGLDPQSRLQLWEQAMKFRAQGGTVLLSTHYMEEAERLCDRVAIMDHGHLIALGSPAQLIASLPASSVVEFATDPMLAEDDLLGLKGLVSCRMRQPNWCLIVESPAESIPALLLKVEKMETKLVNLSTHHATLEDVFVALTGRHLRDG
jgi:ABC-2 type transport system ATP-binding protein